jgi:protein TonB
MVGKASAGRSCLDPFNANHYHSAVATLPIPIRSAPLLHACGASPSHEATRRATGIAFALALTVHVGLLAALWSFAPARKALLEQAPIAVELLTPPRVEPAPPPPPAAVRPHPAAKPHAVPHSTPPPILAAPAQTATEAPIVAPTAPAPTASAPIEAAPAIAAPLTPLAPPAPPAPTNVVPPRFDAAYLRNPAPDYPPLAKRRGEQGRVEVRVLVSADGDARTVEIRSSSGSETLDHTALDTVRRWRFVPARLGSTPVEAWVIVPLSFSLTR